RIRPTWGPLPCVTTTSQPAAAMAATRSAANRAERRMFSAVSSFPRRSNAFPPNATTTRFTGRALRAGEGGEDVLDGGRPLDHVDPLATTLFSIVPCHGTGRAQHSRSRIGRPQVRLCRFDLRGGGAVHPVYHGHVGHAEVGLAGMEAHFVARPQGIRHHDLD